jgi:hypothetical protein
MVKAVVPLLIVTALLLNPIVVAALLPRLAQLLGPGAEEFTQKNEGWVIAVSAGYFMVVLSLLAGRFTARRRGGVGARGAAPASPAAAPAAPAAAPPAPGTPYRGPGGGKKAPSGRRGRLRR